jgi:hypothetical protein
MKSLAGETCRMVTFLLFLGRIANADIPSTSAINISVSGNFASAANGGGSNVTVDRAVALHWEAFRITDRTNPSLADQDIIWLQALNGDHLSAECGGGSGTGAPVGTVCGDVDANRAVARSWETFRIIKRGGSPGSLIQSGDQVALMSSAGNYCSAENGGGQGSIMDCTRSQVGGWETWTLTLASVGPPPVAIVRANLDSLGAVVPADFIGFSDELSDVITDTIFTPANTSLINLVKLLGPIAVWRIGGNASDSNPAPALTPQIASDVHAFISAVGSGWKVVYGLDSAIQDPVTAVTQAGYMLNAFSSTNIAFQFGNEPDGGIGRDTWVRVFNSYYDALTTAYSNVLVGGPDTIELSAVFDYVDRTEIGRSGFQYLTGHKYTLGCTPVSATVDRVLADAVQLSGSPGFAISEFGIICGGGQQGITDRLMAATYYLRLAQTAFSSGFRGIWPHNVLAPIDWGDGNPPRKSYYNQFVQQDDGGYSPAPMFYGMYLFAQLAGQSSVNTTTSDLSSLTTVNATLGASGGANILVVNGDTTQAIAVQPQQTRPWSTGNVYLVSGTGCGDPSPLLNGLAIGEGGSWGGSAVVINNGDSVYIPVCGAALIEIQ